MRQEVGISQWQWLRASNGKNTYNWRSLSFESRNLVAPSMFFLKISCCSPSSLGVNNLMYLFMNVTNCFLSKEGCSCKHVIINVRSCFARKQTKIMIWQGLVGMTNLKPKGVNNVNNLNSLVINTLIIFSTFSRRVCTNVYINSTLNNPLHGKDSDIINKLNLTLYEHILLNMT